MSAISRASGRQVRYVPVCTKDYEGLLGRLMPQEEARFLTELFAYLLDGHNAHVTSDVERVFGRKARDFDEYARNAAKSGVWNP